MRQARVQKLSVANGLQYKKGGVGAQSRPNMLTPQFRLTLLGRLFRLPDRHRTHFRISVPLRSSNYEPDVAGQATPTASEALENTGNVDRLQQRRSI